MARLLLWILSFFSPADMTARVAVEAAYVLHTQEFPGPSKECCGACKNGRIVHGDGHTTPCPCPTDCKCKTKGAVVHPPAVISPPAVQPATKSVLKCVDGKCVPQR
jgi:hypothetical protein